MEPPHDDLESALRHRARQAAEKAVVRRARLAVAAAKETVARARALAEARRLARDPDRLLKRCAWCGRATLGGEWLEPEEAERLLAGRSGLPEVSHTICPDCSERLVRERKSH